MPLWRKERVCSLPSDTNSVAAATFVAGYNPFAGRIGLEQDGRPRRLTGFGMVGSAAIGEAKLDIYLDTEKIGTFLNQAATGTALTNDYMEDVDVLVHPNQKVGGNVVAAAATNPVIWKIEWEILTPEEYADALAELGG